MDMLIIVCDEISPETPERGVRWLATSSDNYTNPVHVFRYRVAQKKQYRKYV